MWPQVLLLLLLGLFPLWEMLWYLLGVRQLYPWQLKRLPRNKRPFVLDVRSQPEFQLLRLPRSVQRPDLLLSNKRLPMAKDQPLLVVCMTGHRSPLAAKRLQRLGYTRVYNLAWGVLGWKLLGGETVSGHEDLEP
ncbi:MAG: rhodanese-like domain-containing protein [Desulfohalobiaceae bacterium]